MSKAHAEQTTALTPTHTPEAFWVTGAAAGEIRATPLASEPDTDSEMVEVETHYSGVSRGTESLVFLNKVPESEYHRMRAPFQAGEFPYPVRHGYANAGKVIAGPVSLLGKMVFCLYSHQTRYRVPADAVLPLPDDVPAHRAVLAANMETAVNGLWDASPRVGDRIAVVGCGVVGTLMAYLANKIPGTRVTAIDINAERLPLLDSLGVRFATRTDLQDHDLVIHASGHPDGLVTALKLAGQEGRIIEMSWFGDQNVTLPLGRAFHARRLTLRSSQVGSISPAQAPRWHYRDRLSLALSLLSDPALDALISGESQFEELPQTMAVLSQAGSSELCHRIIYPPATAVN
ncbi:zinc-dependent alcohol dehydrogenase [Marinobacter changyiensis]|uniref:zinc-dependent alcohol dehydrogenase n=1 Tax=Marinobacter changyiensis TaxID=2604091 RepID=UPI0012652A48|nr:zinc-binding alcohol dehydrogenase [Marinobacter changyiensis]